MNFIATTGKIIAIDFDGTIVEHKYPAIGKEMEYCFTTLKALQLKGHRLILWTYRKGKRLEEAVDFCTANNITFYAINENYPGETIEGGFSRKIDADIFIDDRNIGGFLGWLDIWNMLHPEGKEFSHQLKNENAHRNGRKKSRKKWFF
ncbi:hypothetical protein ORI89_16280 [Sphingobacterium sp. UT-1RO-CII-1]|uniref:BT0820 family HAD-type phosphatase n=1 Tax=Sphingobacterium sp. UT-1RO-CII-1 TaxID=2995225 RepID=UPI00227B2920|nr:hypothetical protein [Sphingobacterium sp. UT-1RO-CII-1]MCY4781221.1 hypothetical protein [Sphingobacterium sp. UT-1RO-CII-1]